MPSSYCIKRFHELLNKDWVGLDVGSGLHVGSLAQWGVDVAPFPRSRLPNSNFIRASLYNLPFQNDSFDYICSAHLIEHLQYPIKAVIEMARVARYMVIANIPRYTLDPNEVKGCVIFDNYYFSEHPEEIEKRGLQKYVNEGKILLNRRGATSFYGFVANHCQWFPNPKDCYELFKKADVFKKIVAEVCPNNCGESNVLGWL